MTLIAQTGHWLVTAAYFVPVVAFLLWLVITQVRERRGGGSGGEADGPAGS